MKNLAFPINFKFRVSTLANDFTATDADGRVVAYVRQKMFKLKEAITIYSDTTKSEILYTIQANKWLDWSAAYAMTDVNGNQLGKIARKGWRSLWKAEYAIIDQNNNHQYTCKEASAFSRIADSVVGEIPVLGFFTGYLFNPTYNVIDNNGDIVARLKKEQSMLGRKFQVIKLTDLDPDDKERIMLGLMMLVLLERRRS
ncbi:LURP-one-related/scramblase family protein [Nonlabens ponticola]|uniref:LURP-one-related family protein n=1 Tax=Nonlabens ponticola TaxID=2496866 RepID=A0A3S9MZN6_9FLAO|nr:hypothetical protein [Nonlabens ponticola]AZQ44725.1 hypothetical protein EJ995_10925 [Nonlabens ponticola]